MLNSCMQVLSRDIAYQTKPIIILTLINFGVIFFSYLFANVFARVYERLDVPVPNMVSFYSNAGLFLLLIPIIWAVLSFRFVMNDCDEDFYAKWFLGGIGIPIVLGVLFVVYSAVSLGFGGYI